MDKVVDVVSYAESLGYSNYMYQPQHIKTLIAKAYKERETHTQKAVAEAEQRGAAYAMCQLAFKTVMDKRKTVKEAWLNAKGEAWAIEMVQFAQANDMRIMGYDQRAAEVNALTQPQQAQDKEDI